MVFFFYLTRGNILKENGGLKTVESIIHKLNKNCTVYILPIVEWRELGDGKGESSFFFLV